MKIESNTIYNMDCLEGMKSIPDGSIDLVVADPPYVIAQLGGGGAFGYKSCTYHKEIEHLMTGITNQYLDEMVRVCKLPNLYLFCSKDQVPQYLNYALHHNLKFDILTWHKSNPVPTCNNKYLSDTEYIIFIRKDAKVYGSYLTKRKWYVTQTNKEDKKLWGHPTCKPVDIVKNFIVNSSLEGQTILDPFMGSGTTAIACIREHRNFIGFELNKEYYDKACERIQKERQQLTLF